MERTQALAVAVIVVVVVVAAALYLAGGGQETATKTTTGSPTTAPTTTTTTGPATTTGTTTTVTTAGLAPWVPDGVVSPGEYQGEASYAGGAFKVYWRVEDGYIYIALVGRTEGWVAIGFEPTTMMKDADMVIAYVAPDGTVHIDDQYSTGATGPHKSDTELGGTMDIEEYGGKEENGVTVVEFKRKLSTGDPYDKDLAGKDVVRIIWALGPGDDFTSKHFQAGYGEMRLSP